MKEKERTYYSGSLISYTMIMGFLMLCTLFFGCRSHQGLSKNEMRKIVRAGIALGVEIDAHDDHSLFLEAAEWLGTPYRNGGNDKKGIDCSGLSCRIYENIYRIRLPRRSQEQYTNSHKKSISQLKQGNLVFFRTPNSGTNCGHVGIYLKDRKFIHSSSSKGVIITSLDNTYWEPLWLSGGEYKN